MATNFDAYHATEASPEQALRLIEMDTGAAKISYGRHRSSKGLLVLLRHAAKARGYGIPHFGMY